jgi:YD repeat-containing protein
MQSPKGSLPLGQTRGYTYDDQPHIISDTMPTNGSVITTSWPVISATLYNPQLGNLSPASGVY